MTPAGKCYIQYPSRTDQFKLWNVSDIHLGSACCSKNKLREDMERIRDDPNSFWVGGGDYADYIAPNDKRWSAGEVDAELLPTNKLSNIGIEMYGYLRDLFKPVRHKCLGLAVGNHEVKYMAMNNQAGLHGWLCTELQVPNLGYAAIFDVIFARIKCKRPMLLRAEPQAASSRTSFRVALHHGYGGATTPAGKLNSLISFMRNVEADIYFFGHVHDQKGQRINTLGADEKCTKLVNFEKLGIISGSYLKTYSDHHTSYGEMKGYSPTSLGAAFVGIRPEDRRVWGEV